MQTNFHKTPSEATVIICGIVRNAARGLKRNIPTINRLCKRFGDYHIVIVENDSTDSTKELLQQWAKSQKNIHLLLNNYHTATIPDKKEVTANPFFSRKRIEKMSRYRNMYLDYIAQNAIEGDYVMVVDLDVYSIDLEGVISSFTAACEWDAVTANGYSRSFSSRFRKRYHDAYALTELGKELIPQTEATIDAARYKWASLKRKTLFIPVFSAFGGLAIYRYEALNNIRYEVLENNDDRVEVRCEHFSLCKQMREAGFDKVFINPAMRIKYQTQVINTLRRRLKFFS
jgi:glycosyltransferase involved in cell wall biosynthesis